MTEFDWGPLSWTGDKVHCSFWCVTTHHFVTINYGYEWSECGTEHQHLQLHSHITYTDVNIFFKVMSRSH